MRAIDDSQFEHEVLKSKGLVLVDFWAEWGGPGRQLGPILEEVGKKLPGFPIVLHGASSVNQDHIKMINEYGGQMPDAIGIPEDMLREAAKMAVCKINVDSDIRIAMPAAIRKHFDEQPGDIDPRKYLAPARDLIEEVVSHKIETVLGCADKA